MNKRSINSKTPRKGTLRSKKSTIHNRTNENYRESRHMDRDEGNTKPQKGPTKKSIGSPED